MDAFNVPVYFSIEWWIQTIISTALGVLAGALIQYWLPITQYIRYCLARLLPTQLKLRGMFVFEVGEIGTPTDAYLQFRSTNPNVELQHGQEDRVIFVHDVHNFDIQRYENALHVVVVPRRITTADLSDFIDVVDKVVDAAKISGAAGDFMQGWVSVQLPYRPERISIHPKPGLKVVDYSIGLKRKDVNCDIHLRPFGKYEISGTRREDLLAVVRHIR